MAEISSEVAREKAEQIRRMRGLVENMGAGQEREEALADLERTRTDLAATALRAL